MSCSAQAGWRRRIAACCCDSASGRRIAAALSVPGVNAFELLLTGRSFTPSAQAVSCVEEQKKVLLRSRTRRRTGASKTSKNGPKASTVTSRRCLKIERLPTSTLADAIAGFAFIGSIFGNGGGGEVGELELPGRASRKKYGESEGLKIFRDLREVNDPEAPTTASKAVPV